MAGLRKAQRKYVPFKGSIQGASGAGKTYSALNILTPLVAITSPGKRIAVIDTEKSAELYSPPFDFDVDDDFGTGDKMSFHYKRLIEKLENIRKDGSYGGVIIDSMTHFWKEKDGFTRLIDQICDKQRARQNGKADSFAAWKEVDPLYRELMTYIRQYPLHIIMCVRAKQAYEDVVENGRKKKVKVGMEPEFREGFEYEVDAQFAIDFDHLMIPLKHRLGDVLEKSFKNPGAEVAQVIAEWLAGGAAAAPPPAPGPSVAKAPARPLEDAPPSPAGQPDAPADDAVDHVGEILAGIRSARTEAELKTVADVVKVALADKLISPEDRNGVISPAYAARLRELRTAAAPEAPPANETQAEAS